MPMFHNIKSIALFVLLLFTVTPALTQNNSKSVSFSFMIKNEKFWPQYNSNSAHLSQLGTLIKSNQAQIRDGHILINITSHCNSYDAKEKNAELSRERAEEFKKTLISLYGLSDSQINISPFVKSNNDILLASLTPRTPQQPVTTQNQKLINPPLTLAPAGIVNDTIQIISYGLINDSVIRELNFIDTPNSIPLINLAPVSAIAQTSDTAKRATITKAKNEIEPPQHYLKSTTKPAKVKRPKQK